MYKTISYTVELFEASAVYQNTMINSPCSFPMELVAEMFGNCMRTHEEVHAVYLDNSLNLRYHEMIGKGGNTSCIVDVKAPIRTMILQACPKLILIHNHPSGSAVFSRSDIHLAKQIKDACRLFNFDLVDFMIVTPDYQVISGVDKNLL